MRFVGIGDLVIDYYYDNGSFMFKCGGKSFANIVFNLDYFGLNTKILGCCGNDLDGDIALHTLGNVDTHDIKRINKPTRRFNINNDTTTKDITWYRKSMIDTSYILNNIKDTDILIFDSFTSKNKFIINNCNNTKVIDIGGRSIVRRNSIKELKKDFYKKFKIINMNEKVANFIISFYKINEEELFDLFGTETLIITRGNKGFTIIHKGITLDRKLTISHKEIDSNGCGDMFFAIMIKHFIYDNKDLKDIDKTLDLAFKYTSIVASTYGSRGYRLKLY